uniref:Uncharacterized protein n=1 Tax=Glossina pallidipes TaxID=7398 RepID=A0A1A9ZM75_GLOPL
MPAKTAQHTPCHLVPLSRLCIFYGACRQPDATFIHANHSTQANVLLLTADLLMKHLRLPFPAKEYITQKVDKEPLLEGSIVCKNLIIEALTYHLLPSEINTVRAIPRKPVECK